MRMCVLTRIIRSIEDTFVPRERKFTLTQASHEGMIYLYKITNMRVYF